MIDPGTYRAQALGAQFGESSKGTKQVAVEFAILTEGYERHRITWIGYFSDKTVERTMESLRICGWNTDDLSNLQGLSDNEVELVVEHEEYEGKTRARVQWVNRPGGGGGGFKMNKPLDGNDLKAFAAQMRGAAIKSRGGEAASAPADKTKVPF